MLVFPNGIFLPPNLIFMQRGLNIASVRGMVVKKIVLGKTCRSAIKDADHVHILTMQDHNKQYSLIGELK